VALLKSIHIACVVTSVIYFLLRGFWMVRGSPWLQRRIWSRLVPDTVDTVLLASGASMMFLTGQYPNHEPWLAAKLLALFVYVVLGAVALHYGNTLRVRIIAFSSACLVLIYVLGVAIEHDPASWLLAV